MGWHRLDETKEKACWDYVVGATSIATANKKVIWDKQDVVASRNAKKPALPYITLNISAGPTLIGAPEFRHKGVDDTFVYNMRKGFTLTVNVFANEGWLNLAKEIREALYLPTKRAVLRQGGLAQDGIPSDVLDVSALLDTKHEGRATFDLPLAYNEEVDDVSGEIRKVIMESTIGTFVDETVIDNT